MTTILVVFGGFLLFAVLAECEIYDSFSACRQRLENSTSDQPIWTNPIGCPPDPGVGEIRVPAYCCGTDVEKFCCEWSTFVINSVGFGRTSLGLVLFVFIFFVAALLFVIIFCGFFRVCCLTRWEQDHNHHNRSRNITSSRPGSFRPERRGFGSVDTTLSVPMFQEEYSHVV